MSNTKEIFDSGKIIKKLRFFLKNISWKRDLTFLFFLLLAAIFWVIQVYTQQIEIKLDLPIKYTNVANNILFESELPESIEISIKDYGSSILKYAAKNDSIEIDMGAIMKEPTTQKIIQGQSYEQLIRTGMLPSSELVAYSPSYISYAYSRVSVRKLPVLFDGITNLPAGYLLDGDITIYPDSVIAYGSSSALDTLTFAYTYKDTLLNIQESQKIELPLKTNKGVKFKPNKIEIEVPVDKFIIKEVNVPIECINLPKDLTIKFFPSEIAVSFFVGLKRYNLIESNNFKIIVDYKEIKNIGNKSIPIRIIDSPDFVRVKGLEPSEVEFILEQK